MHVNPNLKTLEVRCTSNTRIQKLCAQLLNYPSGLNDGVDSVSQFLIWSANRLVREGEVKGQMAERKPYDSLNAGMAAAFAKLRQPQRNSDMGDEHKWIQQRF